MAIGGRARSRRKSAEPSVAGVLAQECAGLALLGFATLAAIALWTYAPLDPVLTGGPMENAGGADGAALAAALLGSVGYGAVLLVAAVAVVGARLTAGRGLPQLASRFWAGAPLLIAGAATLPPLLSLLSAESFGHAEGGWLGDTLAAQETWLLGLWGSLLLNAVLLAIGTLVATGLSTGRALAVVGVGIGWLLGGLAAVRGRAGAAALDAFVGARQAIGELLGGIEPSIGLGVVHVRVEVDDHAVRPEACRVPFGRDVRITMAS